MSAVIGALRGVLSMDSAAFETGARRAKATMGTVERRMVALAGKMEGAGRKMALGLTLPMASAAAVAVRSSLQVVDAQAKMAQSLETTVVSMQVLERAADLSGVSMGEVQQASIQLTKRLSQAAGGSGAAAKALQRLHLTAKDLQALPLDARLEAIQSALGAYVPQAERAAVASDLFGSRAGLIFTRIDGSALRLAAEDVSRFGVAVSEVDADQIELTNDALSRMGLAGRGLANQLTVALAPALQGLSDRVADVAGWFNSLSDRTKQFIATGALIAGAVGPAALALGLVLKVATPLALSMTGLISTVALAPVRFAAAARSAMALEMALGATSARAAVAGVALKGLQRGLVLLRGALIATGIGALVVGAGMLAMKLHDLVVASGSWGGALRLLGDVASGVWEGIRSSAAAIGPALKAIWADVQAGFTRAVQSMALEWGNFLWAVADGMEGMRGMAAVQEHLRAASDTAIDRFIELDAAASGFEATAIRLRKEAAGKMSAGFEQAGKAMAKLGVQVDAANAALDKSDESTGDLTDALGDLEDQLDDGGSGGVAAALEGATEQAGRFAGELSGAVSTAVDGVSRAFGDWVASGLSDFSSMWDGIKAAAQQGLADLAASFASNQIQLALGLNVSGGSAAASAAGSVAGGLASGGAGSSGLLGAAGSSLLGGSSLLAGIGGGLQASLGLGAYASAGLFNVGANAAMASAVTGAGALATTLGAALPVIGIALAGAVLLKKALGRKLKYTELEGTIGANGFDGRTRKFYKGGWFRSDKNVYGTVDSELDAALDYQVAGITSGLLAMSEAVGQGSDALAEFEGYDFSVRTSGRSEEEIQEDLAEQMAAAAEEMAALILGSEDFSQIGETATETLSRLSSSLLAVNDAMDLLEGAAFDVSLAGADLASDLVEAFGDLDQMSASVSSYFTGFYTSAEQSEIVLRRLRQEFEEMGIAMPASRAAFREIVDSLDLTTEGGQSLYAQLLQLSGAMNEVLPQIGAFTEELQGIADEIGGEIGVQIEAATEMVSEARAAAEEWRRAAEGLRGFVADLIDSDLTAASSAQVEAAQSARLDAAFAAVQAGDVSAAEALPDLARSYLQSARASASSDLEYRRIAAEVQSRINFAAGVADVETGNDEVLAGLYQQQIEVLTSLGNFLQLESLTDEEVANLSDTVQALAGDWDGTVAAFETSLSALEDAIESAEAFSYDDLVGALDVAVTLDDAAPTWLRRLVEEADTGIRTTLDFIIRRDDLSAADRWIATHALSEHVATIDLVLGADLDPESRKLALTTAADLRRSLRLELGRDLDPQTRALVLTQSASLSRRVNVALTGDGALVVERLSEIAQVLGDGSGSGRLTFGGGVVLEADGVFADLASQTGQLRAPLERLRSMLGELRTAVEADRRSREIQTQIAALQAEGQTYAARLDDRSEAAGIIAQIEALEAETGVSLTRTGGRDADLRVSDVSGRIIYDADYVTYGSGADLAEWRSQFWADGGLQDQLTAYNRRYALADERAAALRAQIRDLGGVPAFARGGAHGGGARIVGERGWEIEHTGPARIHSHSESVAMLDNRPLTRGVEELTRHVVAQGQVAQLLMDRIARQIDDWNDAGLPEVRV